MKANEQVYLATIEGAKYGMGDFPNGLPGLLFGVTFDSISVSCISFQGSKADELLAEAGVSDVGQLNGMKCYVCCDPGASIVSFIRLARWTKARAETILVLIDDAAEEMKDILRRNAVRFWPLWENWIELDPQGVPLTVLSNPWRLTDGTLLNITFKNAHPGWQNVRSLSFAPERVPIRQEDGIRYLCPTCGKLVRYSGDACLIDVKGSSEIAHAVRHLSVHFDKLIGVLERHVDWCMCNGNDTSRHCFSYSFSPEQSSVQAPRPSRERLEQTLAQANKEQRTASQLLRDYMRYVERLWEKHSRYGGGREAWVEEGWDLRRRTIKLIGKD